VGQVLSIPALGEVLVPAEDARRLNTLNMRRLGQIELRPAPSEFLSNLPRAVMILGWRVVGLIFGGGHCSSVAAARSRGRGSWRLWSPSLWSP
jgi:hypothetical protein